MTTLDSDKAWSIVPWDCSSEEAATGILTSDMKRVVQEQRLAFVATVCPDGTPYVSPKGTLAVWDDDHLAREALAWISFATWS